MAMKWCSILEMRSRRPEKLHLFFLEGSYSYKIDDIGRF